MAGSLIAIAGMWWFLAYSPNHQTPPAGGPYPTEQACEDARSHLRDNWKPSRADPTKLVCAGKDCYLGSSECFCTQGAC